jgi:hypothetical protein
MFPINVALLSESEAITLADLSEIAAALQKQATRDIGPIWNVTANVSVFGRKPPIDYWPITVVDDLGLDGLTGYHSDENGQPYSLVAANGSLSITLSHELIEMLVDPFGSRMVAGWAQSKRVNYLVEPCDPCENDECAYSINGIKVSDFVTPAYYGPVQVPGVRYCYSGRLDGPRQLKPGGYMTWLETESGEWFQKAWFGTQLPEVVSLGRLDMQGRHPRTVIDALTRRRKHERGTLR